MEVALSFSLAYALLAPGGFDGGVHNPAASHALITAAAVGFTAFLLGAYRPQLFMTTRNLLLNTALGSLIAFPTAWAVSVAMGISSDWLVGPDRAWPTKTLVAWTAAVFAIRLAFLVAVRSKLLVRRFAIHGAPADLAATVNAVRASRSEFIEIVSAPPQHNAPHELRAARIRHVLLSASALASLSPAAQAAYHAAGVSLEPEPVFWERRLRRIDFDNLDPEWFARLEQRPVSPWQAAFNRCSDIALSLALLLFTLPLMLLVALLVRLSGPGPALYRQERVGQGGKPFTLLKFRSMRIDAESTGPAWAQQCDPRVTRVGALLRRTRIDELPQLLNVLRGQMSFIGPRPERPHFVEQLGALIPHYAERARVKPGLTGWAQVNYPYGASVEDARAKLSYDLFYVKNRTVLLDFLILVGTVRVILFQEGAR